MSARKLQAGLLAAGLTIGIFVVPGQAVQAAPRVPAPSVPATTAPARTTPTSSAPTRSVPAPPAPAPSVPAARAAVAPAAVAPAAVTSSVTDPTNLATDEDKVKAAGAIGINPGIDLLVLNDQGFAFALYGRGEAGPYVKAEALRSYLSDDPRAAYEFIVRGIFVAAKDDAQAKIAEEAAKGRRRSVAVTVGLDPSETALIEKNDRDFIFSIWQRVTAGSHVWTAARDAIADGTKQADWDTFLNTGAQVASDQDMREAIEQADEELAAQLRARQLAAAKRSLLQLLLLPVTEELINAPNRQFVLHVHNNAKHDEVSLASQVALNAPDDQLAQALSDFIFTGGAAANKRDEAAAAAIERDGYRTRVIPIRDAAKHDGFQTNVVAAAETALAENTVLSLQTFLLKGQDQARAKDRRLDFTTGFETTDPRPNWQDLADVNGGGSSNIGGIIAGLTKAELGVRAFSTGAKFLLYSGKDNSTTSSYSYNALYTLSNATVRPTTKLSYQIYPESSTRNPQVAGDNSTCVAVDLIFTDGLPLRDSNAKDQNGNSVHPGGQCGKLVPDAWNTVTVDLGAIAAGRTIQRINVGYDQAANTGGYRGYIDNLKLADLDSAPKFRTSAEPGDTKPTWVNSVDTVKPGGGTWNVGPIVSTVTGPEFTDGAATGRTGPGIILYSGKDNGTDASYAYLKGYSLPETFVSSTTELSYWIYPQSSKQWSSIKGDSSTCVAIDLILQDKIDGSTTALRDTGVKDQRGTTFHPAKQCSKVPLDTWSQVIVPLGPVANGKKIVQIDFGYDQAPGTGDYRGFLDDVRITQ
jgi:hypothetical protein